MNDRFKFRVWNKEQNRFHHSFFCDITASGTLVISQGIEGKKYIVDDDNYVVQQCTGLKDKNGKLIYEGDIVRDKCSEAVATIEYLSYTFSLMAHIRGMDDYLPLEDICYALEVTTPFEVIGNIYENPELLEVSNDH